MAFTHPIAEKNYKNLLLEKIQSCPDTALTNIDEKYRIFGTPHSPEVICKLKLTSSNSSYFPAFVEVSASASNKLGAMHSAYKQLWGTVAVYEPPVPKIELPDPEADGFTFLSERDDRAAEYYYAMMIKLFDFRDSSMNTPDCRLLIEALLREGGVEPNPGPHSFCVKEPKKPLAHPIHAPMHLETVNQPKRQILYSGDDTVVITAKGLPRREKMRLRQDRIESFADAVAPRSVVEVGLVIGGVETHPGPRHGKYTVLKTEANLEKKVGKEEKKLRSELKSVKRQAKKVESSTVKKVLANQQIISRKASSADRLLAGASHKRAVSNISASLPAAFGISQDMDVRKFNPTQRVLWSITAPKECPPVRFCDEYANVETSLANPWSVEVVPWNQSGTATSPGIMTNNDMFIALFRQAERGSMITYNNPGGYTYNVLGKNLVTSNSPPALSFQQYGDFGSIPTPIPIAYAVWFAGTQVHSTIMFCASQDGLQSDSRRYLWLNAGDSFGISGSWSPSETVNIVLDQCTPGGILPEAYIGTAVTGTSGTWSIPVTRTGYYCPSVVTSASVSNFSFNWSACSFVNTSTPMVIAQRPVAGFDLNWNVATSIRIPAAAMLYTNKAAEMYKSGFFAFLQPPKGVHITDYFSGATIKNVMSQRTAVDGQIKNGCYAFLKPTADTDFEARNYTQVINGALYDSYFPLNDKSEFAFFWLSIPYTSGANAPTAQDGLLTMAHGVEFEPLDTWRTRKIGTISQPAYRKAIAELRDIPQVHENPFHLSDIWNGIASAGKWIWNNGAKGLAQTAVKNALSAPISSYKKINNYMNGEGSGLELAETLLA